MTARRFADRQVPDPPFRPVGWSSPQQFYQYALGFVPSVKWRGILEYVARSPVHSPRARARAKRQLLERHDVDLRQWDGS